MQKEVVRPKTPANRLMDMLAGWSEFVNTDEQDARIDPCLSAEEIGALYQEAAALVGSPDEAVKTHHFLISRVLPLLLRE